MGQVVGTIAVIVVILLAVGGLSGRARKRGRNARRPLAVPAVVRTRPSPSPVRSRVSGATMVPQYGTTVPSSRGADFVWQPPGAVLTVAGYKISGGMVYVGKARGAQYDGMACIIDPMLPVARPADQDPGARMGYWPSYRDIAPSCRLTYLQWLSSGKCDPNADIGYVFLYFYGLERRLLVDRPAPAEEALLVAELSRLRSIYAVNGSFEGYSRVLLETVEMIRLLGDPEGMQIFEPDLSLPVGRMPPALKVAIARKVVADQPLAFNLAAAGLIGVARDAPSLNTLTLDRARPAFLQLLRPRFEKAFPQGLKLRNRKDSHLRLEYRAATAGLRIDLAALAKVEPLPDPATLTWTKLLDLAMQVAGELQSYASLLAYHPDRAKSLSALVGCPPELSSSIATEARAWVAGLPRPIAATRFAELARNAIGVTGAKWTARHHRLVAQALACVERGLEPDLLDGSVSLSDDTPVFVFPDQRSGRSPSYAVAATAAILVAGLARASVDRVEAIEAIWLEQARVRLGLAADEMVRLRARLWWLRGTSGGLSKARRLLAEAPASDRETVAWSAAVAAGAGGLVEREQVAVLETIYGKLGVSRQALYATLHAAAASSAPAASEPITVAVELPEAVHAIPRPPESRKPGLDEARIQRVRAETARVSSVLAEVFVEEETTLSEKEPDRSPSNAFTGLDAAHTALVERLLASPNWSRAEFETAARADGLMPDGALEAINEWAFERFDEPLLEDGDALTVNAALLVRLTERADDRAGEWSVETR